MFSSSSSLSIFQGVNDVQDYVSVDGEELAPDHFSSIFDLVKKGNRAFRDGRFEEAIHCYSKAYTFKPGDPIILSNRCAAYLRISDFLKLRPAAASEYRPLNGLDPTIHAELALKDAEKLMSIQGHSVKAYVLKANALFMLEKYEIARDVILSGLQVDPLSNFLQDALQVLEKTEVGLVGRKNHGKADRTDDFDCTLCLKLIYDPITTPCGHSFCRDCLFQSMDRSNKCPLCRTVLFISPRTCALSVTLNNIIQKNFPEEYAERKAEHNSLTNLGVDLIPLFVMDVILPCQKISLHIFEPRYRLMVRRIMEGNHRMGMMFCSIFDRCEPLPDGRFYLEIESRRRFQIIRSWDQDGYRVAEVEWIHDDRPPEGTQESAELLEIANNAAEYARSWITRMKEAVWQDRRNLDKLLIAESLMPSPQDPERFSFWINTLSHQRPTERLKLLRLKDTREVLSLHSKSFQLVGHRILELRSLCMQG